MGTIRGCEDSCCVFALFLRFSEELTPIRRVWLLCLHGLQPCRNTCNACIVLGRHRVHTTVGFSHCMSIWAVERLTCCPTAEVWATLCLCSCFCREKLLKRNLPSNAGDKVLPTWSLLQEPEIVAIMLFTYSAICRVLLTAFDAFQLFSWPQQPAFYRWLVSCSPLQCLLVGT